MTRHHVAHRSLPYTALMTLALTAAGCHWPNAAERSADPIIEKNVAARGGLKAWRGVKSMTMSGSLEAGKPRDPIKLAMSYLRPKNQAKAEARKALVHPRDADADRPVQLPFVMELERPRKTRLEIRFQGQTAVQVYDGSQGWKVRPFLGRKEVESYSPEELKLASQQTDLDGPLIDASSKGNRVELVGNEPVDGRDAYKLKVTSSDGHVRHVWVDAQSYLDVRVEGSRRLDGKVRTVWTTLRDYRPVDGVMVPHLLETTVEGVKGAEKIMVERVVLNPKLDQNRFSKPSVERS